MTEWFSTTALAVLLALVLDRVLGEPSVWHPLVGFGRWVDFCRARLQMPLSLSADAQRLGGIIAWSLAVLPWMGVLALLLLILPPALEWLLSVLVLYFCIGWQSLRQHAQAIEQPLLAGQLPQAREAVGRIVSRDTDELTASEVAKAGIESVLENGSDAIFAPLFCFIVLGAPGVLLYRLANTLDAMWGYKSPSLLHFGWCAARIDDVLNFIPARLVVYTYGACGNWRLARQCARQQSYRWKSPNAGPVMAAGAGALGVQLGGAAVYFGQLETRPVLGKGEAPMPVHLTRAIELIDKGVWLWAALICILI